MGAWAPQTLTNAEELRVHAVEVGDKDEGNGTGGVEKEQETGRQVQN